MSVRLDARLQNTGTRFRLFPQPRFLSAFRVPETVTVSVPPDQLRPGPADARMFVVDAVNKSPYNRFTGPPYLGPRNPPVKAGPDGHFDHIGTNTRAFSSATMYATVRRVLDIWEDYFGHRVEWQFESDFARLELIPLIEWDNAQSGYGFLEFGFGRKPLGGTDHTRPYCQNFDVLAHELGHSLIFSQVGVPTNPADRAIDYGGMQESSGDLVAIVAVLHFHSVVDHLVAETHGNLFTVNELDRVGELSASREIRVAFNSLRMSDVGAEPHDRSLPLTGAIFDVMVEVFQKELVARGLISDALARRSTQDSNPDRDPDLAAVQADFDAAYRGHEAGFKESLLVARDYLGHLLARAWERMDPNFLTYHTILRRLLRADRELGGGEGRNQDTIRECFAWREITLLPDSMLLRPHAVDQAAPRGVASSADDERIEAIVHRILGAGKPADYANSHPAEKKQPAGT